MVSEAASILDSSSGADGVVSRTAADFGVSQRTLEDIPRRVWLFLDAIQSNLAIRRAMTDSGYSQDDHDLGRRLINELSAMRRDLQSTTADSAALKTRVATTALAQWQATGFVLVRSALRHNDPDVEQFVFDDGLVAGSGPDAIFMMQRFLSRLASLKNGADRKATRKTDHAALAMLAKRGVNDEVLGHLRDLVDAATKDVRIEEFPAEVNEDGRQELLLAIYKWWQDWSDVARVVVTSRHDRIKLGIAHRRKAARPVVPTTVGTAPTAPEPEEHSPESRAA